MSNTFSISKNEVTSLAIGGFDGIHKAHQELIKKAEAILVINKYKADLTPKEYRCKFVKKPCFFYELNKIKELGCGEFAKLLREEFSSLKKIVVGYDFRYGYKRECLPKDLMQFFEVEVVDEVKIGRVSVHSGVIRELLKDGKVQEAKEFLGRAYSIEGEVVKGQGLGKKELVPTINITVCDFLLPKSGVYATKCLVGGKSYNSVTFVGIRVSTDGCFSVESHLIDEEIEIALGEDVEIYFFGFIRENRKFSSLKELNIRISKDIEEARNILKTINR